MDLPSQQPLLVTGATGFIGARLARRLIARGGEVSCLVRAGSRIEGLRQIGARLITGDVADRASVERALAESRAATVFHVAGLVKALHRRDFSRVNVSGVEAVAAACAARDRPPILVVVSSLAAAGPCAADRPSVEGDVPGPVSNYGRSKLDGEQAAAKFSDAAPITIVRPPIVFGPGDRGVLEILRPIARWGVQVVPGWGSEERSRRYSMLYVDDLVEALLLAAEKGERLNRGGPAGQGLYFFASEERPTLVELGQMFANAWGRKPPVVVHLPEPLVRLAGIGGDVGAWFRRRPGWLSRDKITEALAGSWTCSPGKARARLGWSPAAGLTDRLSETATWYRRAGWL